MGKRQRVGTKTSSIKLLIANGSVLLKTNIVLVRYILLVILFIIVTLTGYIYFLIETQARPDTYAFNKNLVSPLSTSSLPKLSNEAVLRWTSQAISDIFTFNFAQDIDEHFKRVSNYFTDDGFNQYMASIRDSGLLSDLVAKQLVYTANSCDIVSILNQRMAMVENTPITVWYMQVPILLQIQSYSPTKLNRYVINIVVEGGSGVRPDKSIGIAGMTMNYADTDLCGIK